MVLCSGIESKNHMDYKANISSTQAHPYLLFVLMEPIFQLTPNGYAIREENVVIMLMCIIYNMT